MVKTFGELCAYFEKYHPHKLQLGRSSKFCIDKLMDVGHLLMEKGEHELGQEGHQGELDSESSSMLDDLVVELRM